MNGKPYDWQQEQDGVTVTKVLAVIIIVSILVTMGCLLWILLRDGIGDPDSP